MTKLKYLAVGALVVAGAALIAIGTMNRNQAPYQNRDYAHAAVMITNDKMNSGGTGVIMRSSPSRSEVLTNKHVCELVQVGGKVVSDDGSIHQVTDFRVYTKHDLCMISVMADLHGFTRVAPNAPELYSESIVTGHPHLLPTIITKGHFSQKRQVGIMVGIQPCDGKEEGDDLIACMFLGGKPIVKEMTAQVVSSLIMPGSSGSAVFNSKGELSGLVFAGERDLSYGMIVPWEYVRDFLSHQSLYPLQTPDPNKKPVSFFASYFKLQDLCSSHVFVKLWNIGGLCNSSQSLEIWNESN